MVNRQVWLNFLALLPSTTLTVLTIAVAFLRFYDERDFQFLQLITNPRDWSNRLTVAAFVVALVNFGVEWNGRNREANRRAEAEQRRIEEAERAARRARVQNRWIVLQARYLLDPSAEVEAAVADFIQFLQEYGEL